MIDGLVYFKKKVKDFVEKEINKIVTNTYRKYIISDFNVIFNEIINQTKKEGNGYKIIQYLNAEILQVYYEHNELIVNNLTELKEFYDWKLKTMRRKDIYTICFDVIN